jgi:DnaJ-class molecular chaperone
MPDDEKTCPVCYGSGVVTTPRTDPGPPVRLYTDHETCSGCKGTGTVPA